MGSFTQNFIEAHAKGQAARRNKRIEDQALEDRDIEKQLLQHRLKEMKIADRLKAREVAIQNAQALEGQPEANFPQHEFGLGQPDFSGGIPQRVTSGGGANVPRVDIPGIDELGVGGVSVQPQTLEQNLAQAMQEFRMKARNTAQSASHGERITLPSQTPGQPPEVLAEGDPIREPRHRVVTRDENGVETEEWLTDAEVENQQFTREKRPPTSINAVSDDDRDAFVDGVIDGSNPADLITGMTTGEKIKLGAAFKRKNFNLSTAVTDIKAFRTYMSTLNSGQQQQVLAASDNALTQLDALEAVLDKDGDGIRFPGTKQAADLEAAAKGIRELLPLIKGGGASPTNKALDEAEKELKTGLFSGKLKPKIAKLRENLKYRIASIKGAFVSSGQVAGPPAGTPGAPAPAAAGTHSTADVAAALRAAGKDSSPETVQKAMANPAIMARLFPQK